MGVMAVMTLAISVPALVSRPLQKIHGAQMFPAFRKFVYIKVGYDSSVSVALLQTQSLAGPDYLYVY